MLFFLCKTGVYTDDLRTVYHAYSPTRRRSFCQNVSGALSPASSKGTSAFSMAAVLITNCTAFTWVFFSETKDKERCYVLSMIL